MSPHYATVIENSRVNAQIQQDPLSADRTILANERTLLSYIRTSLTLLAASFTFINFFPSFAVQLVGWVILVPVIVVLVVGSRRYLYLRRSIRMHFSTN